MADSEDAELRELRELKAKLVKRVHELQEELGEHNGQVSRSQGISFDDVLSKLHEEPDIPQSRVTEKKDAAKLCEVSQSIVGVQFKDVEKNWIRDNIYQYKTQAVSKALQFELDVTIDVREKGFVIQEINCGFLGLDRCFLEEINSWTSSFSEKKQFSYLISGIADYSDQSVIRAKILRTLESEDYITMEKCNDKGGGVYVYVHPPGDKDRVFFKFHWSTEFVERTWRIEHIFAIHPIEAGETFVKDNEELLQGFCRIGLRKSDLEDLWNRLCTAIDDIPELEKQAKK